MKGKSKKSKIQTIKRYKNLPKYDLAAKLTAIGYQPGNYDILLGSVDRLVLDLRDVASAQRKTNIVNATGNALNLALGMGGGIKNLVGSYRDPIQARIDITDDYDLNMNDRINTNAQIYNGTFNPADAPGTYITGTGDNAVSMYDENFADTVTNRDKRRANRTKRELTKDGSDAYMNGLMSALTGGTLFAKGLTGLNNPITNSDIQDWSGSSTNYGIAGRQYTSLTSPGNAAMSVVNQRLKQGVIDTTLGGSNAGSGIGQAIGEAVSQFSNAGADKASVIGRIGGGIVGFFAGLGTGIARKIKSKKKAKQTLDNASYAYDQYNQLELSQANTLGLRDQFYGRADLGKPEFGSMHGTTKSSTADKVWTPDGVLYGPVNSLVGKGETIADLTKQSDIDATLVTNGTERVDNQPCIAKNGDSTTIFGNAIDPLTGVKYSKLVEPMTKYIEYLNSLKDKNSDDPTTKRVLEQEINKAKEPIAEEMRRIARRQEATVLNANGGNARKLHKFDLGQAGFAIAPAILGTIGSVANYNEYNADTPKAYDIYASNPNAQQAYRLMRQQYDVTPEIEALNDNTTKGMYLINQQNFNPGARMSMMSQLLNDQARAKVAIYQNKRNVEAGQNATLAQMMMSNGEQEAARRQAANQVYGDVMAKARRTRRLGKETNMANIYQTWFDAFKNLKNNYDFERNLNLYSLKLTQDQKDDLTRLQAIYNHK